MSIVLNFAANNSSITVNNFYCRVQCVRLWHCSMKLHEGSSPARFIRPRIPLVFQTGASLCWLIDVVTVVFHLRNSVSLHIAYGPCHFATCPSAQPQPRVRGPPAISKQARESQEQIRFRFPITAVLGFLRRIHGAPIPRGPSRAGDCGWAAADR
jgi:hypothetical protein